MVKERLGGDGKQYVLQFLEVLYRSNLLVRHWVAENKVAEAYLLSQNLAQVKIHVLRVLIDESSPEFLGIQGVLYFGRLDDKWHEGVIFTHMMTEFDTSHRIFLLSLYLWETDISDDT